MSNPLSRQKYRNGNKGVFPYCIDIVSFAQAIKAGNLKSAMSCDYVKNYEFVAIFDADFQPGPDFLKKTIPYFKVTV
jgi:hypothetical protein